MPLVKQLCLVSFIKRKIKPDIFIYKKNFPLFLREREFIFIYDSPFNQLKTLRKWCDIQSLSTIAALLK